MSTEKEFLAAYNKDMYDKPSVAIGLLVFTISDNILQILLIKRGEQPYKGKLALPGVFVGIDETLDDAARRGAREEAGLSGIYFEQLYTWGDLGRDPRMRIISVSYMSITQKDNINFSAGMRTESIAFYDVDDILSSNISLAFDHKRIIQYARERIKNKTGYTGIAFEFLCDEFTLPDLQKVYEILLGRNLYKANFRRKILPFIVETDKMTSGDAHRPSKLYKRRTDFEIKERIV